MFSAVFGLLLESKFGNLESGASAEGGVVAGAGAGAGEDAGATWWQGGGRGGN